MHELTQVFNYENVQVRTTTVGGEPWFIAADVCTVLDISKHRDALTRLDDDERGSVLVDTLGGPQEMGAVNESGLYSLIMTSRKPVAKKFKKWVTAEVLPTIRKTGGYGVTPQLTTEQRFAYAILDAQRLIEQKDAQIEQRDKMIAITAPKAAALDRLADAEGLFTIREAAKALKHPEKKLVFLLLDKRWLYRDQKNKLRGYADKTPRLITHKSYTFEVDGEDRVSLTVMLTAEGLTKLSVMLGVELNEEIKEVAA